jgi:hypothetical protein
VRRRARENVRDESKRRSDFSGIKTKTTKTIKTMNDETTTVAGEMPAGEGAAPVNDPTPPPDYIPTDAQLDGTGASSTPADPGASDPNDPLNDPKDVERDYAPVLTGKVPGVCKGAHWYRKDGSSGLSIRLTWETAGDVTGTKFEKVTEGDVTKLIPETSTVPAGETIDDWLRIKADADKSNSDGSMTKSEHFAMDQVGRYYLAVVKGEFTGKNGSRYSDAKLNQFWRELVSEGYAASSKDVVKHPLIARLVNRPMILGLSWEDGDTKGEDGVYHEDSMAPKRQRITVMGVGKGKG